MIATKIMAKVKTVCKLETFQSGFQKRVVAFEEINDKAKRTNILPVAFTKDRAETAAGLHEGDVVQLDFAIDGREWTNPRGETKYFVDLVAVKCEVKEAAPRAEAEEPDPQDGEPAEDMPF